MVDMEKARAIRKKAEALAGRSLGETGDALAEIAAQRAMAYCCREDIPEEMEQAAASLALALSEQSGGEGGGMGTAGGVIRSIQRGDTSVTYATDGAAAAAAVSSSGMAGALAALAPWRRLGRLREDLR